MASGRDEATPPVSFADALDCERAAMQFAPAHVKPPLAVTSGHHIGLALSGGGIRAATFSLGVIQAIAKADKLSVFDYLSTVSGGGYIGAWLTAWIHRQGMDTVKEALKPRTATVGKPIEAPEVTWLRRYSNYMAPNLGLLSADSMTLIATWTRNVLLNLVIVISLLAFAFVLPRLLLVPAIDAIAFHSDEYGYAAAWLGFFLFPAAISFNLSRMAVVDSEGRTSWVTTTQGVFATVIAPGVLATVLGSLSVFSPDSNVKDHLAGLAVGILALFAVLGVFWSIYQVVFKASFWTISKEACIFLLAYAVALIVGYLLVLAFTGIVIPVGKSKIERAANILTFGPPALLVTFGVSGSIVVGLVGRVYYERSREWWGRMNAWFVTIGAAWLVFFLLVFYVTPLIDWAHAMSGTWVKALTGAGWAGSLVTTLLVPKPGTTKTFLSRLGSRALDLAASIVVIGFVIAVAYGTTAVLGSITKASEIPVVAQPKKLTEVTLKVAAEGKTSQFAMSFSESKDVRLLPFVEAAFRNEQNILGKPLCRPDAAEPSVLCRKLGSDFSIDRTLLFAIACLAIFLLFGWRVDVNKFSLHNLYKNRLVRCYLGASRQKARTAQPFTGFDDLDDLELYKLRAEEQHPEARMRPLHIVNTALNLTQGTNLAWQERKAASFSFTPWHCGYSLAPSTGDTPPSSPASQRRTNRFGPGVRNPQTEAEQPPIEAYRDTKEYASEKDETRHVTLGMAMATSGAAVSPNMGMASTKPLAFVMTLFNVRLGRWSPNPNREKWRKSSPTYGLVCLLQELFGFANESRNFVHLSDGGHFDNTGIYELVRRRCMTILAVDAGADVGRSFGDLANLVRKCRVDLGVNVVIDLNKLGTCRTDEAKTTGYSVGCVHYGNGVTGRLIVIKPTLIDLKERGVDVFGYSRLQESFPQQSTADQFFDESQFESYRALGELIASACLKDKNCQLT